MFDRMRVRRESALVLLLLLSACAGGAQTPTAPPLVPTAPVPTTAQALPSATVARQPSLVPSPSITSLPTHMPSPAPSPTAIPAPLPTAIPAPNPPPPSPTVPDAQSSASCIPSGALLPGLPTVSEIVPSSDPNRMAPAAPP